MSHIAHKKIGGTAANIISYGEYYDTNIPRLWRQMTGKEPLTNLDDILRAQVGIATEPLNAKWLTRTSDYKVHRGRDVKGKLFEHANGFSVAQLDGKATHPEMEGEGIFEAKHTGQHKKMEDVLETYFPQIQHYMFVLDVQWAVMSVFFGNSRHQYRKVRRDNDYIADLIEREAAFWKYVEMDMEPPVPEKIKTTQTWTKKVDMTGNNEWASFAHDWLENKDKADTFTKAAEGLKELIPADAGEASGHGIIIKRDVRGGRRIWASA